MLIVVDTNIIVSALLSPDSSAYTFLSEVMDGKHTVLISSGLIPRSLLRNKLKRNLVFDTP